MDEIYNGIDVSRWQGVINWPAVKASGVQFAMIRVGYCDYAGSMVKDIRFESNMAGATAAGIDVGAYVYAYAKTPEAATSAAKKTLELLQGYQLTYPVAFDIEDATHVAMTPDENTAITKAYLSAIAAGGYCPLLYTYKSFAESKLNMSELAQYDFWLAHMTSQTDYAGDYTVWQYSWTGTVNGIGGDVDLNYCYKDYPTYIKENGLNGFRLPNDNGEGEESSTGDGTDENDDTDINTGDAGDGASGEENGSDSQTPNQPQEISYVVVKNDTLYHIAKRYGIPLKTLIDANPQIKNPDLIYIGDTIHIPQKP